MSMTLKVLGAGTTFVGGINSLRELAEGRVAPTGAGTVVHSSGATSFVEDVLSVSREASAMRSTSFTGPTDEADEADERSVPWNPDVVRPGARHESGERWTTSEVSAAMLSGAPGFTGVWIRGGQDHLKLVELDRTVDGERSIERWVIPVGFTYLLGDRGQTLDKL